VIKNEARQRALKEWRKYRDFIPNAQPLIVLAPHAQEWRGYGTLTEEHLWKSWEPSGGPHYEVVL
jgi:hypothetical protein